MQLRVLACTLALLLFAAPALAARARSSAAAGAWLREHPAPQGDDLAELKTENPEAYAIVKALLTKRSLGLLNPKHPSASFAAPAEPAADDAAPSGPAAFQALASSGSSVATAAVYPEAPAAQPHRDWLHWQPKRSALDDEAMVNSVLGAVAELKTGAPHTKSLLSQSQGSGAVLPTAAEAVPPPAQRPSSVIAAVSAQAPQQASPGTENSYLAGLDLGGSAPVKPSRADDQENSYLASVNLSPPKSKPSLRHDSADYLASFSWDDEQSKPSKSAARSPTEATAEPQADASPPHSDTAQTATQAPQKKKNALLAWLGGSAQGSPGKPSAAAQPAAQAAEEHRNPYMSYLH
uniref:Uncharacterized protein n=1 Tax=Alexandrium catenella TaxID=2925 RepID=A0A7S1L2L5_ALECA